MAQSGTFIVKDNIWGKYLSGFRYHHSENWPRTETFWTASPGEAMQCPTGVAASVLANLADLGSFEIVKL